MSWELQKDSSRKERGGWRKPGRSWGKVPCTPTRGLGQHRGDRPMALFKDTASTCTENKTRHDFKKSPRPFLFLSAELQQSDFNQSDFKFRVVKPTSLRSRSCRDSAIPSQPRASLG